MSRLLQVDIEAVGLLGPGLDDWAQAQPVLADLAPWKPEATRVPFPDAMPPAERRRCGMATKTALAVGQQALRGTSMPGDRLATVFTSSGGDAVNCHEICAALATTERLISPTRFHNSVHNAPSGYWSIHSGALAPSSAVCAHDGSFAAGLLDAMTQVHTEGQPVLLVAYDTRYPEPLYGLRPIPDAFGVALLLAPPRDGAGLRRLALDTDAGLVHAPADTCGDARMEQLRTSIPAARCLPLLRALARAQPASITLDYLDDLQLRLHLS